MAIQVELRLEVEDLYAEYCAALDEGRYEDWAALFTEDCLYRIVPRDNHDRGLPLGPWWLDRFDGKIAE